MLRRKILDPEQLNKARNYATAVGLEMRDAVIQQKLASADVVMPLYAESLGLSFLDLAEFDIDLSLIRRVPAYIARQQSLAPVMIDANQLLIAAPHTLDPQVEDEVRLRAGMSIRTVICTPTAIHDVVNKFYTKEQAATELASSAVMRPAPKPKAEKSEEAVAKPDAPITADEYELRKDNRRNVTLMTFNFTVMMVMIGMSIFTSFGMLVSIPSALLLGGIGAGIAWMVAK